jgi:hypothetical protein
MCFSKEESQDPAFMTQQFEPAAPVNHQYVPLPVPTQNLSQQYTTEEPWNKYSLLVNDMRLLKGQVS